MFRRKKPTAVAVPDDELGLLQMISAHGGEITFGAPTRCPNCGDYGFVEAVAAGVQRNRCMQCGEVWQFSQRGLELFAFAKTVNVGTKDDERPQIVGKGTLVNTANIGGWARLTRESFVSMKDAMRNTFRPDR